MPILDHFRPPVYPRVPWESFHSTWAINLMMRLNEQLLPDGYQANSEVHLGQRIEVDVATFEDDTPSHDEFLNGAGAAVATETWAPPKAVASMPATFPDSIGVLIHSIGGMKIVGAIEFVSESNKDRPEHRLAFAHKISALLQRGIGVLVVDIVTTRHANLHDELVDAMNLPERFRFPSESELYTTAYHPIRRTAADEIDLWAEPLHVGGDLPTMPLFLRGGPVLGIPLQETYTRARRGSRL